MQFRYDANSLIACAKALCLKSGMNDTCASDVASILTEGDLLGHDRHGLMLLKPYLDAIKNDDMLGHGEIEELSARPAAANWDGNFLAGQYLTLRAIETATSMAKKYGTGRSLRRDPALSTSVNESQELSSPSSLSRY